MLSDVDSVVRALFIVTALSIAGLGQTLWLRHRVSRRLAVPLDGALTLRGRRILGDNKTLRGFVVMVPTAGVSFLGIYLVVALTSASIAERLWPLSVAGYAGLGLAAGLGLMLGELPNSFVKRQLDIAPGRRPSRPLAGVLVFVVDRLDSVVGMLLLVSLFVPTGWHTWAWVLLIGPIIHYGLSYLLFVFSVKESPA